MVGGLMLSQASRSSPACIYIFFDNLAHRFGPKNGQPKPIRATGNLATGRSGQEGQA